MLLLELVAPSWEVLCLNLLCDFKTCETKKSKYEKKTCNFVWGHKKTSFVHNREILHEAETLSLCQTTQGTNRQTWIKLRGGV
jgi:hypothetical protein